MDNEVIVNSIKNLCKSNNITVGQLEKDTGLSQGLVSKWINTNPSLDKIIDIADYFNISVDEVIGRNINDIDDEFLSSLYEATEEKYISWNQTDGKEFELSRGNYDPPTVIFYTNHENKCNIIMLGEYEIGKDLPKYLTLYINMDGMNFKEPYETKELQSLWNRILVSTNNISAKVKKENNKRNFIDSMNRNKIIHQNNIISTLTDSLCNIRGSFILSLNQEISLTNIKPTTENPLMFFETYYKKMGKISSYKVYDDKHILFLLSKTYLMKLDNMSVNPSISEYKNLIYVLQVLNQYEDFIADEYRNNSVGGILEVKFEQ